MQVLAPRAFLIAMLGLFAVLGMHSALACKFTPLAWQQPVTAHVLPGFVGQAKHLNWSGDRDGDFIDDRLTRRFGPGSRVDVIVNFNRCITPPDIRKLLAPFGSLTYIGKLITFALLADVRVEDLASMATLPEVAMIEWQSPGEALNDIASRAVQSRATVAYPGASAEELGYTGAGVSIAVLDYGVDNTHPAFAGRFVAGFDATTFTDSDGDGEDDFCEGGICTPADGSGDPEDETGHGTHLAGIALGGPVAGAECREPALETSDNRCAGIAPGAGLVDVKVCRGSGCANLIEGLDWIGINARRLNIRAANISLRIGCDSDGNDLLSQQVDYLAAVLGITVAVAHGNAGESLCPGQSPGDVVTGSPQRPRSP